MKKIKHILITLILIGALLAGCQSNNLQTSTDVVEQSFQDGIVYDDLSDRFTITLYPTKLITENGKKNIVYSITVENKSEEEYKNFEISIAMDKSLDQYIGAGVEPFPITHFDMAAKSDTSEDQGKGADVRFQQLLSDDQFMSEAGIKYQDILELGKNFELLLQWDGGEEKYKLTADVIDEITPS